MKTTVVIEGQLANCLPIYIREFKPEWDRGFNQFPDEAILFALLEYSTMIRPYTKIDRIRYVYEKCHAYLGSFILPYQYIVEHKYENDTESWFIKLDGEK